MVAHPDRGEKRALRRFARSKQIVRRIANERCSLCIVPSRCIAILELREPRRRLRKAHRVGGVPHQRIARMICCSGHCVRSHDSPRSVEYRRAAFTRRSRDLDDQARERRRTMAFYLYVRGSDRASMPRSVSRARATSRETDRSGRASTHKRARPPKAACGRSGGVPKRRKIWSGRRGSNPRPRPWQGRALPLSYTRIRDGGDRSPSTAELCQMQTVECNSPLTV